MKVDWKIVTSIIVAVLIIGVVNAALQASKKNS